MKAAIHLKKYRSDASSSAPRTTFHYYGVDANKFSLKHWRERLKKLKVHLAELNPALICDADGQMGCGASSTGKDEDIPKFVLVGETAHWLKVPNALCGATLVHAERFMAATRDREPLPPADDFLWAPSPRSLSPRFSSSSSSFSSSEVDTRNVKPTSNKRPRQRAASRGESSDDEEGLLGYDEDEVTGKEEEDVTDSESENIKADNYDGTGALRQSGSGCLRVLSWNVKQLLNPPRCTEEGKRQAAVLFAKHEPHIILLQVWPTTNQLP